MGRPIHTGEDLLRDIREAIRELETRRTRDPFDRGSAAAAPIDGEHILGERVWNSTPAAGDFIGWVCVGGGTPGTWKGFGLIDT